MPLRVIFQKAPLEHWLGTSHADETPKAWKEGRFCEKLSSREPKASTPTQGLVSSSQALPLWAPEVTWLCFSRLRLCSPGLSSLIVDDLALL